MDTGEEGVKIQTATDALSDQQGDEELLMDGFDTKDQGDQEKDQSTAGDFGSLGKLPSEKVMKRQVRNSIEKEISSLHGKAQRMRWFASDFNPFEYQEAVKKIRELQQILNELAYMAYESIKGLWLKHVKRTGESLT